MQTAAPNAFFSLLSLHISYIYIYTSALGVIKASSSPTQTQSSATPLKIFSTTSKYSSEEMACWSAENATNAYLRTMRMGKSAKEPNGAEFISALAAGNNAQLMVVACSGAADSTTLALLAAAQQTGGRLVCILRGQEELCMSRATHGLNNCIEFVAGDAKKLLSDCYKESDFVAIDCNLENHEEIINALQEKGRLHSNTIVLGYNAFCRESWKNSPLRTQLLPIGEGLLLTRVAAAAKKSSHNKSNWIVKVDKCTGEEHVFRVRSSEGRFIRA